jgi:hypothetical protein
MLLLICLRNWLHSTTPGRKAHRLGSLFHSLYRNDNESLTYKGAGEREQERGTEDLAPQNWCVFAEGV